MGLAKPEIGIEDRKVAGLLTGDGRLGTGGIEADEIKTKEVRWGMGRGKMTGDWRLKTG